MQKRKNRGAFLDGLLLIAAAALFLMVLILPVACAMSLTEEEAQLMAAYEQGEIIRLHVVANSDSARDQQIKIVVRDAVLSAFGRELAQAGTSGSDEAYRLLVLHQEELERIASSAAKELGFAGNVEAEVGMLQLPEKRYGQATLPAGSYRGLRITLGQGQGRNWWCVLFPQLCLALSGEALEPRWNIPRVLQHWMLLPC